VYGVAVVLAAFALITLLLAWSRWLAGRRLAVAGHLLMAVTAGWAAAWLWPVLLSLETYEPALRGQPVADLYIEQTGSRKYRVTLTRLPAGQVQVLEMTGDQWRLEVRTLDWRGWAARAGIRPVYRLERLSARHVRPVTSEDVPASSYTLGTGEGDDVWAQARTSAAWARLAQAGRVEGPWEPLANGARFLVRREGQLLRVEAGNEAAAASLSPPH
jgi:hypothetical protein